MGGHEAGEVASRLTVQVIESFIDDTRNADLNSTWPFPFDTERSLAANRLIAAFRLANQRVASAIAETPALKGMATTGVAILLGLEGVAEVAHVGDSRVYQLRDGVLRQLTNDHSWVGEQVRAGVLSDDDAQRHPWRNVVTRAISGGADPEVELSEVALRAGDRLLVCSDGLSSVVQPERLKELMNAGQDLDACAEALIAAANEAGGPDNITVILVEVDDTADVA
jgi:protein phosphatase